jgi:MoxR-like ATPase
MPSDITGTDVSAGGPGHAPPLRFNLRPGPVFYPFAVGGRNQSDPSENPGRSPPGHARASGDRFGSDVPPTGSVLSCWPPKIPLSKRAPIRLPEAQLDRFLFQINMDYPSEAEERQILIDTTGPVRPDLKPVLSAGKIVEFQDLIRRVPVAPSVVEKTLRLVRRTRPESTETEGSPRSMLAWGAGPRAGQALLLGAKVRCLIHGRFTVSWDDVAALAAPVLRHRLIVSFRGQAEGRRPDELIHQFLKEGS